MADRIRRIVDPAELASVLRHGVGYVFSPVNRTVHVAGCGRVGRGASPSEPKIFAADDESALAYQARRLGDYQPFRPARCCRAAIDERLSGLYPRARTLRGHGRAKCGAERRAARCHSCR